MYKKEMKKYQELNKLAESNGVVILGGTEDKEIPLCELKQAFDLDSKLYNRSITELSIDNAFEIYDTCISPINPECILLHIGIADLKSFEENPSDFDQKYLKLIQQIKVSNSICNIVIISLRNCDGSESIDALNKHLRYIADSEQCEYMDISTKWVWNPNQTKDVLSFLHSTGFVLPLKKKRLTYDLVKILYCYEPACIA